MEKTATVRRCSDFAITLVQSIDKMEKTAIYTTMITTKKPNNDEEAE